MRFRPAFFLLIALAAFGLAAGQLFADTPTESKVRLMSEALAARDAGDFATARHKLESVLALVPNDAGVRRLMSELETREAAEEAARKAQQQAAAAAAATPLPAVNPESPAMIAPAARRSAPGEAANATLMTVPVITEGKPQSGPPSNLPEGYAAALAKVETAGVAFARSEGAGRLEKLMTYVQAQRDLARLYARDGNYPMAMSTLDSVLASLKTSMGELRAERNEYERQEEMEKEGVRQQHRR